MQTTEAPPMAIGDAVELIEAAAHVRLPEGSRGTVVCDGLPWQMVTVVFGKDPERGKAYLLRPAHLQRVPA